MTTQLQFIGTQERWFETAVTGKSRGWRAGMLQEVSDEDAALLYATGMFRKHWAVPVSESGLPPVTVMYQGPFASLPPATTQAGALAAVTDLGEHGLCLLRSNGTVWRPISPITLVAMRSAAGQAVAAGGSDTALGTERLLPGGLVQPGDMLRFMAWATCPTADTSARVLSIAHGTAAGFNLVGTRLARFTSVSSSANDLMVDKVGMVVSNTQVVHSGSSDPGAKTNTTDLNIETVHDLSANSYIKCAALPTAGSAWTIYGMALQLIPGG